MNVWLRHAITHTGDSHPSTWRFAVKTMPIDQSQAMLILASESRPHFKDATASSPRSTGPPAPTCTWWT